MGRGTAKRWRGADRTGFGKVLLHPSGALRDLPDFFRGNAEAAMTHARNPAHNPNEKNLSSPCNLW
jgi:hypothetical protein